MPIGFPANNSAKVSWTNQRGLQASLLAELLAGPEGLRAELSWARMGRQAVPRWELHSRLQHQSGPLAIRGLPSSMQADAHYQVSPAGWALGGGLKYTLTLTLQLH